MNDVFYKYGILFGIHFLQVEINLQYTGSCVYPIYFLAILLMLGFIFKNEMKGKNILLL